MAGLNTAQIIDRAKSLGKNISSGEADSILKQSFNQSLYGADPSKVDSILQGYGSSSSNTSTPFSGNSQSYIQSAIDQVKKANEPAIKSAEASIPETQKRYSTQRENIKSRYDNLIASIKGNQQIAETRQTTATNNELGRRGIVSSSGIAEQEMANALNPITQQYTGLQKEAIGAQGEEEAANVAGETDALRAIQNLIAQLTSGATTQGIQLGSDMYKTDKSLEESAASRALQAELAKADEAFKNKQFDESVRQFNTQESRLNKASDTGDLSSLFNILGIGNVQGTSTQGKYIPEIGKSVVGYDSKGRAIYSDGTRGYSYGIKS